MLANDVLFADDTGQSTLQCASRPDRPINLVPAGAVCNISPPGIRYSDVAGQGIPGFIWPPNCDKLATADPRHQPCSPWSRTPTGILKSYILHAQPRYLTLKRVLTTSCTRLVTGPSLQSADVMSHLRAMEIDFQEQFRNSRPQRLTNEAALFVENRIVLPQQQPPIYAEQLDQFVPLQEAIRQQQIRCA